MLKIALVCLYGFEALFLLVPWQYFQYGRLDFALNEGIVYWLGVPIQYMAARLVHEYGPLRWVRSLAFAGSLLWILVATVLHYDPHGFGPRNQSLWFLTSWIPATNFVALLLPSSSKPPQKDDRLDHVKPKVHRQ